MTGKITSWKSLFSYWSVQLLALIGAVNAVAIGAQASGAVSGETIGDVANVTSLILAGAAAYARNKPQPDVD
jgi:hypothetical protein